MPPTRTLEPLSFSSTAMALGRESLVILYTPVMDRTFSALARRADRYVEIVAAEAEGQPVRAARGMRQYGLRPAGQRTLEVR